MVRTMEGKHSQYYEAILQLRDISPEIINLTEHEIASKRIPISKKVKMDTGWDYYLADKDFTKALGKKLQEKFGGKYNVSATLHGRKDGRELYRLTVLFRGFSFIKGSLVKYKGEMYYVKILGKIVMLQNVDTGEKVQVRSKDLEMIHRAD